MCERMKHRVHRLFLWQKGRKHGRILSWPLSEFSLNQENKTEQSVFQSCISQEALGQNFIPAMESQQIHF